MWWTSYERGWVREQKESTKRKSGAPLAKWQAEAFEEDLELFAAHIVPLDRAHFNPLYSGPKISDQAIS